MEAMAPLTALAMALVSGASVAERSARPLGANRLAQELAAWEAACVDPLEEAASASHARGIRE